MGHSKPCQNLAGTNSLPLSLQNVPPEDYRLTSRIPAGCTPTMDCSYFMGIRTNTNSSFLDIYLEGVSTGWVAVGITSSANMVNWTSDLLCSVKDVVLLLLRYVFQAKC